MKQRNGINGQYVYSGGKLAEKRDKPCPDCGKMIMRKSARCRSCSQSGIRHYLFGSNSYSAIHKWLAKYYIKEKCEFCSKGVGGLDWAKISEKYTRNRDDYLVLCHKCHMEYDNIGYRANITKSIKYGWKNKYVNS